MLKKIAQRIAFGRSSFDPVAYWRRRADDPDTQSVMWENLAYNELVDRDDWKAIANYLPPRRGSALDLGCGTGRMSRRLAAEFDEYVGVDLDTMVAEARRRNPALAGSYVEGTVETFEYPTARFDFVSTIGVLATACTRESLPDAARKITATLKPGGRVMMLEPFHTNGMLTRGCRMTAREVADVFEGFGLRLDVLDAMLFFPVRMVLGEKVLKRFPRVTRGTFWAGEKVLRLDPMRFGDYAIIGLSKPD